MNLASRCLFLWLINIFYVKMTDNRNTGNYDSQPYVVGILSPTTTLYIDQTPDNRDVSPPTDLNLRRRNTNSFQITSVTVQGSRKNDDFADDSADDLDESHTDDLSSDFLDSSRADNEGYHSEDSNPIGDDLSPCGPIIFAHLPSTMRDPNMNLSLGVTPTFTAIGPNVVAGGVTMMTSKSESPISAQVPIMNPLPDNWQRRFKVVKIVSSEPFRRGRWLCMDFKDPPASVQTEPRLEGNGTSTPPTIQITNCDSDNQQSDMLESGNYAHVYEIPIDQTFNGNFVMGSQQHMYGIILPQNEHVQPVTLVQDVSLQTAAPLDRNFNVINNQSVLVQAVGQPAVPAYPAVRISHRVPPVAAATLVNNCIPNQSPPSSLSANNINASQAVLNHINTTANINQEVVPLQAIIRTSTDSGRATPASLSNHLPPTRIDTLNVDAEETESSQTAPEKIPSSEVGHEVDPTAGSAASTGGNTVAIDNKIEQAMDLVKSHLMFAVREEVEVLKEKITELLERISQLEHENDILRANASAETLKQLNNQKTAGGGTTGKPQQVAPVPPST